MPNPNKKKVCFIELNRLGEVDYGVRELRIATLNCLTYHGEVVKMERMENLRGDRIVFADTHSKCKEVFDKALDDEIEFLIKGKGKI